MHSFGDGGMRSRSAGIGIRFFSKESKRQRASGNRYSLFDPDGYSADILSQNGVLDPFPHIRPGNEKKTGAFAEWQK